VLGVADGVLFRPLPYRDPSSIRVILMRSPGSERRATLVRSDLLQQLGSANEDFSAVGAIDQGKGIVLTTAAGPKGLLTANVTPNYFAVLGVRPYRGRLFSASDAASPNVALLAHKTWQDYLG